MEIIMISGKSNSGKGTVAEIIEDNLRKQGKHVVRCSLSTYIRQLAKDDFYWDGVETIEFRKFAAETYRIGTDFYPYHMARRVWERDIQPYANKDTIAIVESFREKVNYEYFNFLKLKGTIDHLTTIRVVRPNFNVLKDKEMEQHVSETDLDDFPFDHIIANSGSIDELKKGLGDCKSLIKSKEKTKLFLDFDNTIVNSTKAFCEVYNLIYKFKQDFVPAQWELVDRYDFKDQCPLIDSVEVFFSMSMLFNKLEFINPDTYKILKDLSGEFQIILVSIGSYENISLKTKWVDKHLPFIRDSIFLINGGCILDKSLIDMSGGIFVDDIESNLLTSNADHKICFGSFHDWNKEWDGEHYEDWNVLKEELLSIARNSENER